MAIPRFIEIAIVQHSTIGMAEVTIPWHIRPIEKVNNYWC